MRNLALLLYYTILKKISWREFVNINNKSIIGDKVKLLGSYKILHSIIGNYTYISTNANISYTNIGKYCSIGPNLICGWGIHPTNGLSTSPMFYSLSKQNGFTVTKENKIQERKLINIGNDVFIGANVTILDGVTIGDGAIIGAGAVVSKDIPPYAIAIGCPITIKKFRFEEDVIKSLLKIKWWDHEDIFHIDIEKYFFETDIFIKKHE